MFLENKKQIGAGDGGNRQVRHQNHSEHTSNFLIISREKQFNKAMNGFFKIQNLAWIKF